MQTVEITQGTDLDIPLLLRDGLGDPMTDLLETDSLTAALWPGDSQAILASPSVVWSDRPAAKATVKITAVNIQDLEPALYQLIVYLTRGSVTKKALHLWLKVKAAPGSSPALRVYGKYADLVMLIPSLESMQTESVQSLFMEEREYASRYLESVVTSKVRCPEYIQSLLDEDKLVVTPQVSQLIALYALSIALKSRVGLRGISDAIPGLAKQFKATSEDMLRTMTVTVTGFGPIHLGSVLVRRG